MYRTLKSFVIVRIKYSFLKWNIEGNRADKSLLLDLEREVVIVAHGHFQKRRAGNVEYEHVCKVVSVNKEKCF